MLCVSWKAEWFCSTKFSDATIEKIRCDLELNCLPNAVSSDVFGLMQMHTIGIRLGVVFSHNT